MSTIVIRNFHPAEAAQVDALALDAFDEYAVYTKALHASGS